MALVWSNLRALPDHRRIYTRVISWASSTWAQFLRSQADVLLGCDFFETVTLTGLRMYVLVVIEHAQRRIPHPRHHTTSHRGVGDPIRPQPRHGPPGRRLPSAIPDRDRDGKFPHLFDAILADAGTQVVLSGVQMLKMNSITERWIQSCRHELLDRTLIWNQRHLLHTLREYERFFNNHRPHQGIANDRPLQPVPSPITGQDQLARLNIRRRRRLGGILNEYHHAA